MAFDLTSSLTSALPTPERAAAGRARATEASGKEPGTPRFDALVDKSANRPVNAGNAQAATLARAKRMMPGQIAGHQDTAAGTAQPAAGSPCTGPSTPGRPEARPARDPNSRTPEGAEETAGEEEVAARGTGEETPATDSTTTATSSADPVQCDAHPAREGEAKEAGEDAEGAEAALRAEATQGDVPQPVAVALAPEAPVVASGDASGSTGTATPAIGGVGQGVGANAADAALQGIQPATEATRPADPTVAEGKSEEAARAQQTAGDLQPGMADQVAARKEASLEELAKNPAKTGGIKAPEESGQTNGTGATEKERAATHEPPALRGSVFTQALESFTAAAPARSNALLAALDPGAAAQAQNARAADVARPTPLQMLPVEIGMQAVRGAREFQIRLDPAELGRVDVKLHINDKGEVNASMIVERPETLQLLRRDAQTLSQAFEQAGLKQGENSLSFSLRGDGQQGQQQAQQGSSGRAGFDDDAALNPQVAEIAMRRVMIPHSSLDLMV